MTKRILLSVAFLFTGLVATAQDDPEAGSDATVERNIFVAIYNHDMDLFTELLETGADKILDQRFGKSEMTPLQYAAQSADMEMVDALIRAGAAVGDVDDRGFTPLHFAAATNSVDCLRVLLKAGADPNAKANNGLTPLHIAAIYGFGETVKHLLDSGADPTVLVQGRTPADWAREKGFEELADMLADATPESAPAPAPTQFPEPAPAPVEDPVAYTPSLAPAPTVIPPAPKPTPRPIRRIVNFDRSVYEGEATSGRNPKPHGYGSLKLLDGSRYEGTWHKGERTGTGTYIYANGNRYTGSWKHDVPDGEGHFEFANGGHVDGTWKRGVIWNASGVLVSSSDIRYDCLWIEGQCVSQTEIPAAN